MGVSFSIPIKYSKRHRHISVCVKRVGYNNTGAGPQIFPMLSSLHVSFPIPGKVGPKLQTWHGGKGANQPFFLLVSTKLCWRKRHKGEGGDAVSRHWHTTTHPWCPCGYATSVICLNRLVWLTCWAPCYGCPGNRQPEMIVRRCYLMILHALARCLDNPVERLCLLVSCEPQLLIEWGNTHWAFSFLFLKTLNCLLLHFFSDFWEVRPSSWEDYEALQEE